MEWDWPQWVYAGLLLSGSLFGIVKPDTTAAIRLLDFALPAVCAWVLYMGGFWT